MIGDTVRIDYTNHRGERAWRRIRPIGIAFTSSEWHPERQWLLEAYDLDKEARRLFALKSVLYWEPETVASAGER